MKLLLVFSLLTVLVSAHADQLAPPSCACARIYMPVCASNGVTYNNMCEFECAHRYYAKVLLFLFSLKTCFGQWTGFAELNCVCTSQYDPVCGSDMRRYQNICTFDCRLEYIRQNGLAMIDKIDCKWLPPSAPIP